MEDNYAGTKPDSASTDPEHTENNNKYPRRVPFGFLGLSLEYQAVEAYAAATAGDDPREGLAALAQQR